jgi:tripartite-type tricarboxylate transporter receptor subunit TctC
VGLPRRRFLNLGVGAAALAVSRAAKAQTYPARTVRIIVCFPPGGVSDILARLLGERLSERLGQPFIVENRPGAGGNIGTEAVARASADGYTLLMFDASAAINVTLYDKVDFNFLRDISPVASISQAPLVMAVHPSVPAKTVPEFIAHAKANSGNVNMASSGNGTTTHVAGELFKVMAGINMVHVPYRGAAPATADLLGGQVQVYFTGPTNVVEYIKAGSLRALAVTTATRWEGLPDTPAIADFVPGYEASTWYGIGVPRDTPTRIVDTLNREINAALADARMRVRLAELGTSVLVTSSAKFKKLIAEETEKWRKAIKIANIKSQ